MDWLDSIKWDRDGLVPVIAQEQGSGDVLMFAWMNREALAETARRGEAVYWSRSRRACGTRARNPGHLQKVHEIRMDCDNDVVLLRSPSSATSRASPATPGATAASSSAGEWALAGVEPVLKDPEHIYK
jgi:phosphoribosyl-AMP cyclohydrolase